MNFNHNKSGAQKNLDEYDYNKDPYGNNYAGIHILPRWREDDIMKKRNEQLDKYKELWSKEIEERKKKKLEEEKKKKEMDILEEERIKKEIEELNKREQLEKQAQKEKENIISKENEQLIRNKFKINKLNKSEENGITNDHNSPNDNINNINNGNEKTKLEKSESFNYIKSVEKLKNKYKDVDLNNIHFYPQSRRDIEIKKIIIEKKLYYNTIKNNLMNNRRSVNEFEFSPNPKFLDDSKNPQIARLKKEVNYGYMQLSSAIKNLRKNVFQADNNKLKAEKQLKLITNDFNKEKKYQLQLDKIEYDKRKRENPLTNIYNNDYYKYTNINDIDPMYYNIAPVIQSNMNNKNEMSNLAKVGQSLIKLNSESEFIPIGMNYYNNMYDNIGINEEVQMENKTETGELKNETIFEPSEN